MSQRIPKDEPLPEHMKRFGYVGLLVIGFLILAFLFHLMTVMA